MTFVATKENGARPLKSARERLDKALLRLEGAAAEKAALRDENERLTNLNKTMDKRLGGAIERLQAVIGEN